MTSRIDGYLDELGAALTVGAHRRRRILDETREHLADASDRRVTEGLAPSEAETASIAAFGPPTAIAAAFDPEPTLLRLGAALYVHLALVVSAGLIAIGLSGAIGGALAIAFGPEYISGAGPSTIGPTECAQLAASEPAAADCASAWSWHHVEETVLYRGLPGVLGMVVLAIHLLLARRYLPRTGWAIRITRLALAAGVVAFAAAGLASGLAYTVLEAESVPLGPSRVGDGWWVSIHLACATAFSAGLVAYAISRRRPLLSG